MTGLRADSVYVKYIQDYGPVNARDIEQVSNKEDGGFEISPSTKKHSSVRRVLTSSSRSRGKYGTRQGQAKAVWYIPEEHTAEEVVRKYIQTNPWVLEKTKGRITRLFGQHSKELRAAWQNIADEYEVASATGGNNGGGTREKTCPFCGEPTLALATHLQWKCEEKP